MYTDVGIDVPCHRGDSEANCVKYSQLQKFNPNIDDNIITVIYLQLMNKCMVTYYLKYNNNINS